MGDQGALGKSPGSHSEYTGWWLLVIDGVYSSNVPNTLGCQIPVDSQWNLQLFEDLLHCYDD